jgi:hypothetical protein
VFLTPQALFDLAEETAEFIDDLRAEPEPDGGLLQAMEATYACLAELQAWRNSYPGTTMTPVFRTAFGVQLLQ